MIGNLIGKHGGFRKLHTFSYATLIHLETIRFCKRFIPWQEDQLGKTAGQMIGAARSGRQNIIEASERAGTSKETEIKLTDVARASLGELLGDYEIFIADRGFIPWSMHSPEAKAFCAILLPEYQDNEDHLHNYWQYYHQMRPLFAPWLDHPDCQVCGNALIILLERTMGMIRNQLKTLSKQFLEEGGFKERMYNARNQARHEQVAEPNAPNCPDCGKVMQKRFPRNGSQNSHPFWGCTGFPACHGTRRI